ncbi:RNA-directed DNA polymerase, eukaryota, reverse transcriptase zinc-binding domain protein [Tanacetum coccineum]|uniref:RNA-directed DNA polymerase, eukaryota, reverse transcriptase zinc-binding domain protein n=1 Tax=Tanacetum coccineum TaxID=301880 RepID=A0ABQ4WY84_9ASTR
MEITTTMEITTIGIVGTMGVPTRDFRHVALRSMTERSAKTLRWWNTPIQAKGHEAAIGMTWNDFKALLVEEFCPSNEMERYIAGLALEIRGMLKATQPTTIQNAILRAGILTDEAISCGTLSKSNETRCRKQLCFNCQRPDHLARECRAPFKRASQVNEVRAGNKRKRIVRLSPQRQVEFRYRLNSCKQSLLQTPLSSSTSSEWGIKQVTVIISSEYMRMIFLKPYLEQGDGSSYLVIMSVKFDITRVKANVVADALSRKERVKPKRVWAMAMTIQSGVKGMILGARGEAFDQDNKALGTRLDMSTACHPQTDGQSEHTIQTLEDMLKACVIDFGGSWDVHLPLAEFSYNNSYHTSIRCAPFEALYGRKCRSPMLWAKIGEEAPSGEGHQKSYADNRRKPLEFEVGDRVMLKVSPWKGVVSIGNDKEDVGRVAKETLGIACGVCLFLSEFTLVEVKEAVSDCSSSKSLGPDDLMASYNVIIRKHLDPVDLRDYRPISLIGCMYKVLSKLLSRKLCKVIHKLIRLNQMAFLSGRQILDGNLIANDIVNYAKKKKLKLLLFKVDFEKAFDSVNWKFLIDIMSQIGFGAKWCKWIHACLSSASISILINFSPSKEFSMKHGLRQGDPLSPFLFLIIAEALQVMMIESYNKGIFKGLFLAKNDTNISLLQNANDALFFGEWSKTNALCLVHILKCFHYVSGKDTRKNKAWDEVVNHFSNRLSMCKSKLLSVGDRLTLIKAVLGSFPLYFFSIFKAAKAVISRLESIRRRFLWIINEGEKKISWVS